MIKGIAKDEILFLPPQEVYWNLVIGRFPLLLRANRRLIDPHVGMHISDNKIHQAVIVEIEEFDSHCSPGGFGKVLFGLIDEPLSSFILIIGGMSLHVQNEEVRPAIFVKIDETRVPRSEEHTSE